MLGLFECPVCLDPFNDASHTPRLLCCGHTICQLCVERLVLNSSLPRHCIRCPQCRALCKWRGIQELPKNYILLHAISSASAITNKSSTTTTTTPTIAAATTFTTTNRPSVDLLHSTLTGTNLISLWFPSDLESKLWELLKMAAASVVLFVFVPVSILHLCFSWWTALLGFVVFSCFSIGVVGIALFLLFLWWTHSVVLLLHRFAKFVFRPLLSEAKLLPPPS